MVDEGSLGAFDQASSDAEQIGLITWDTNQECETFTIDFTTAEGAPATTPPSVSGEFLREVGVVRIEVDVESTTITDQLVESALVDRLFVVRKFDRTLFIDFHLTEPASAHMSITTGPGHILVQIEAGGDPYPANPAVAANVVVISPTEGPVSNPVVVTGYSRNFEANTIGRITQGETVLAMNFTTAADWAETWGEFTLELNATGSGEAEAELFAGEQSAQDGSDRGVLIDIILP
jgi:hypothetical protein